MCLSTYAIVAVSEGIRDLYVATRNVRQSVGVPVMMMPLTMMTLLVIVLFIAMVMFRWALLLVMRTQMMMVTMTGQTAQS